MTEISFYIINSNGVVIGKWVLFCQTPEPSSFALIQPSFVKLTQLAQLDKTSHAWKYMELKIARGTSGTESTVTYLEENPRTWVQLPSKF